MNQESSPSSESITDEATQKEAKQNPEQRGPKDSPAHDEIAEMRRAMAKGETYIPREKHVGKPGKAENEKSDPTQDKPKRSNADDMER